MYNVTNALVVYRNVHEREFYKKKKFPFITNARTQYIIKIYYLYYRRVMLFFIFCKSGQTFEMGFYSDEEYNS